MAAGGVERQRALARWRSLANRARTAAEGMAEARDIGADGRTAQLDWVVPSDGRAESYLFLGFTALCKAWGAASTKGRREILAPVLGAAAEAVLAVIDDSEPLGQVLPFRQDIDG